MTNLLTILRRNKERRYGCPPRDCFQEYQSNEEQSIMDSVSESVGLAVIEAAKKEGAGGVVVIQNLHVQINYASGGGATVNVR